MFIDCERENCYLVIKPRNRSQSVSQRKWPKVCENSLIQQAVTVCVTKVRLLGKLLPCISSSKRKICVNHIYYIEYRRISGLWHLVRNIGKTQNQVVFQQSGTMVCLYTKQNLFMYLNAVMTCSILCCSEGAGFGSSCCQYSTIWWPDP